MAGLLNPAWFQNFWVWTPGPTWSWETHFSSNASQAGGLEIRPAEGRSLTVVEDQESNPEQMDSAVVRELPDLMEEEQALNHISESPLRRLKAEACCGFRQSLKQKARLLVIGLSVVLLLAAVLYSSAHGLIMDQITYVNPTYQKAFQRSIQAEKADDYAAAIRALMPLYQDNSGDYSVVFRLGNLYYLQGEHSLSIKHYLIAARIEPRAIEPWLGMLRPQMALNDYQNAITTAKYVLQTVPGNYTALSCLGVCNYWLENYSIAVQYFEKLAALYPSDVTTWGWLGWCYYKDGDKQKAKKAFEKSLLIDPYDQYASEGYLLVR